MTLSRRTILGSIGAAVVGCSLLSFALIIIELKPFVDAFIPDRPLQAKQREAYIAQRRIEPLLITEINDQATAIMYRNPTEAGYFIAWAAYDDPNNIGSHHITTNSFAREESPALTPLSVVIDYHMDWHMTGIIINDTQLAQQAHTAKVVLSDGQEIELSVQPPGAALVWHEEPKWSPYYDTAILYNAQGQEIFRKTS